MGKERLKTSGGKNLWVLRQWEKLPASHESSLERPTGTQNHSPRNQHQKGPLCFWIVKEVTESWVRAQQTALFLCDPSPTYSTTTHQSGLPHPGKYLRLAPYNVTGAPRQKNMAQIKEQIRTSEKELSDEEIVNLSEAEFNTLVIRMLTELNELGCKMKEDMKATQSEIKQNIQGTNSDRKRTRTQSNDLEQKEELNIQLDQNKETRIQKNEKRLRILWDNLKHSNT